MEWSFRLMQAPGRMAKRYLVRGPRVFGLLRKAEIVLREESTPMLRLVPAPNQPILPAAFPSAPPRLAHAERLAPSSNRPASPSPVFSEAHPVHAERENRAVSASI
jgi:hypothetical protein